MLLKFNQKNKMWERVKTKTLKLDLTLEIEDSFSHEMVDDIKKANKLNTDEDLINYFKEQIILAGKAEHFEKCLGVTKASVKEIVNISMVEDNE